MQFSYKRIRHGSDTLLAIADADVVGKTFSGGDLEVTVGEDFYGGQECTEQDVPDLLRDATIVNAMGIRIVSFMVEHGLVDKTAVLRVGELHHAQLFVLR